MSSEYDIDIEDYIKPEPPQVKCLEYVGTGGWLFFGGRRGGGKSTTLTSCISTPYGFKMLKDLSVGDVINNPDGSLQKVIYLHPIENRDVYRLHFEDGTYTDCSDNHLWNIKKTSSSKTKSKAKLAMIEESGNPFICNDEVWTMQMIMDWLDKKEQSVGQKINLQHLTIPLTQPVKFTKSYKVDMRPFHPYLLGVMLGDGSFTSTKKNNLYYSKPDNDIVERLQSFGYIVDSSGMHRVVRFNDALMYLKRLNLYDKLSNTKFIPESYKCDTIENRILLIQGLMDTDGYVDDRGHMSYTTVSKQLALDFQWVVRSLGAKATITQDKGKYKDSSGDIIECKDAYTVYFNSKINSDLVWLPRKRKRTLGKSFNGGVSELRRRITKWEYIGKDDMRCITVSNPNGLYLTDDFVVTHNSWLARASTMIVCHRYPGIVCCIIRATESELKGNFIDKFPLEYPEDIFGYIVKSKDRELKFDNGSKVVFRPLRDQKDAEKIQGLEYQYIVIDEANNFDIEVINKIKASLRSSMGNEFIPTLLMTGNPGGYNDLYFKTRYVQPDYSVWRPEELEFKHKYVFIESKTSDNPYLTKEYYDNLKTQSDKMRRAWLDGDWNAFEGQFFDEFDTNVHYIDEFDVPKHWRVVGCMDLGYTVQHPTVCYWLAQDPETLKVYVIREYVNVGAIKTYCADIKEINNRFFNTAIIYADPSMWSNNTKRDESDTSPANYFISEGVPLMPAKNDRVNGWRMLKLWMHHKQGEGSMLYIFKSCPKLAETLPLLKHAMRNGTEIEDMDSRGPDDAADALRYGIYTAFDYPSNAEKQYRSETYSELRKRPDFDENAHNIYSYCDRKYASALATF